jgi:hypothetical protein
MRRSLTEVNDAQMVQIVAPIDRMAERGAADELIAPLRARLARYARRDRCVSAACCFCRSTP